VEAEGLSAKADLSTTRMPGLAGINVGVKYGCFICTFTVLFYNRWFTSIN